MASVIFLLTAECKNYPPFNSLLQWRCFIRNEPIRNMNCLWRSCLLSDRDEMSNRYRGPSMDASYQVSIHLANQKQELPVAAMFVNR